MSASEQREWKDLPTEVIQQEVTTQALDLLREGLLANGLNQLVIGSAHYRRSTLFFESCAGEGIYHGDSGYDEKWQTWVASYDPYSGENLAGTALYQHERYSSPNESFPQEGSDEYNDLVNRMGQLGELVRIVEERLGWVPMGKFLFSIDLAYREESKPKDQTDV